jgi:polyhydroxyalkanoate synthesis regulator phasin
MTREKVEETVSELVKKGEMSKGEGKRFTDEVTKSIDKAKKEIDTRIHTGTKKAAEALNLVTRDELKTLERKVTRLSNELKKQRPTPKRKTKK